VDIIYIHDLRIETVIGIFDWERKIKQTVVLDIEMAGDCRKAARNDDVEDTLNYKSVAKRLIAFVGSSEYQLVETLAERCAAVVLEEFQVPWVKLRVNKQGALRGARDVGVIIERGQRP
jgi:dihydroneopterin aldolase